MAFSLRRPVPADAELVLRLIKESNSEGKDFTDTLLKRFGTVDIVEIMYIRCSNIGSLSRSETSSFSIIALSPDQEVAYGFMATSGFPPLVVASDAVAKGQWLPWLQRSYTTPSGLKVCT